MGVFTCAFIYVFTYVLLRLRVWRGAKKTNSDTLPQALFTFLFETWSLIGQNSPYRLGWLSSKPQGPAYFLLPGTR